MTDDKHKKSNLQKSDSLCKNSTRIAANIVRSSSLCLARICLLPLDLGKQRRRGAGPAGMRAVVADTDVKPWDGEGIDKSSWEARRSPAAYLLESPHVEKKQARFMREGDGGNVNEKAANYISKIRRRNLRNWASRAEEPKLIPPPRLPSPSYGRSGS